MKKVKRPKFNIFHDAYRLPYDETARVKLYHSSKGNLDLVQRLSLLHKLPVHTDCVNTICWNETGEYILSGSDDQRLVITNGFNYKVATDYKTTHRANIFSAKFLPFRGDTSIVSCSGDGIILYTDLMRTEETRFNQFNCHTGTTYEVATVPLDPNSFLSCGEDGMVRWFDIRLKEKCFKSKCDEDVIIACQKAVTALAVNASLPYQLAVGCADSTVRIYDRRMLLAKANTQETSAALSLPPLTVPTFKERSYRITSLCFSPEGEDILVSYSSDHLYLFNVKDQSSMVLKSDGGADVESAKRSLNEPLVRKSPPMPVRRLRLRGDWSDTGPNARPEREGGRRGGVAQARPTLHATLMQRMTFVLSRTLNDPATRAALSGGGEDALHGAAAAAAAASATASATQRQAGRDAAGAEAEQPPGEADTSAGPADSEQEADTSADAAAERRRTRSKRSAAGRRGSSSSSPSTPPGSAVPKRLLAEGHDEDTCTRHVDAAASSSGAGAPPPPDTSDGGEADSRTAGRGLASSSSTSSAGARAASTPDRGAAGDGDGDGEAEPDAEDDLPLTGANSRESVYSDSSEDYVSDSEDDEIERRLMSQSDDESQPGGGADVYSPIIKQKYTGHRNARTMIKEATFWGSEFVMSGSDCGHIFVWERQGGRLVMLLQADEHVVNCLQPHPSEPLLASSGIDHDIKLWAPLGEHSHFDSALAGELTNRNALMLEETRDTITVPASFMIRMMACLNQIRRGGRGQGRRRRHGAQDE